MYNLVFLHLPIYLSYFRIFVCIFIFVCVCVCVCVCVWVRVRVCVCIMCWFMYILYEYTLGIYFTLANLISLILAVPYYSVPTPHCAGCESKPNEQLTVK
jgi:hypothetical protein